MRLPPVARTRPRPSSEEGPKLQEEAVLPRLLHGEGPEGEAGGVVRLGAVGRKPEHPAPEVHPPPPRSTRYPARRWSRYCSESLRQSSWASFVLGLRV